MQDAIDEMDVFKPGKQMQVNELYEKLLKRNVILDV
jgi:hypothetical protein